MQQPQQEQEHIPDLLHSDDDEFHEAADGGAPPPPPNLPAQVNMVAFEDENGEDAADLFPKVGQIKLAWLQNDVKFWFRQQECGLFQNVK